MKREGMVVLQAGIKGKGIGFNNACRIYVIPSGPNIQHISRAGIIVQIFLKISKTIEHKVGGGMV